MCEERREILLPRYAEESADDWRYVLENTGSEPSGCQNRLYRIADLAFKGIDLISIHSGSTAATPSGDH